MTMNETRVNSTAPGRSRSGWLPLLLAALSVAPAAMAQSEGLNVQRFTPAPGGALNFNQVEGTGVVGHLDPTFGLFLNYGHRPLVLRRSGESFDALGQDITLDVLAAIGVGKRFQIGVALPFTAFQQVGSYEGIDLPQVSAQALNDLRIVPKVKLLGGTRGGLSLSVPLIVPTGSAEDYHGEAGFSLEPRIIGELPLGERLRLGLNLSYLVRPSQTYFNLTTTNELRYGAGLALDVVPDRFTLLAEAFGGAGFGSDTELSGRTLPLEANIAGRFLFAGGHSVTLGAGPGITIGYGTPTFRALVGYAYTPARKATPPDKDGDGLVDAADRCPAEAEDRDNFEDEDGCPDLDNDRDGIADSSDRCRDEAEDRDSFEDEDGCPDPDNDQDGVADSSDRCPAEVEDRDGFEDDDGCADPDNDKDGIADSSDRCPNDAEDMDQLGDDDGCPERDFDKDGIFDEKDKCPRKPETINGNEDEDGCPDEGKASVQVTDTKIEILEKVYFATDSAEIQKRSHRVLKQVISVLKANPQITKVWIEGHTDDRGNDTYNLNLSQARVESVKKFLEEGGIEASRLEAKGYGETKPIAPNTTEAGRAKNRRVEFTIVEIDGKPVPAAGTGDQK